MIDSLEIKRLLIFKSARFIQGWGDILGLCNSGIKAKNKNTAKE